MKITRMIAVTLFAGAISLSLISCKKDKAEVLPPVQLKDSLSMPFMGEHFSFYSLKDGKEIALADSATTKWDFAIRFTTIIFNSHASGPGQGGVIVKQGSYDDFAEAPTTGYAYDTTSATGGVPNYAVEDNPRSPDAWYNYIPTNHKIEAKAGWFFVIKTAEGKYAKLEISEAVYGGEWDGNPTHFPEKLIYKFRYVYQPDGSTNLAAK